jgi:hypothetical protein
LKPATLRRSPAAFSDDGTESGEDADVATPQRRELVCRRGTFQGFLPVPIASALVSLEMLFVAASAGATALTPGAAMDVSASMQ